MKNIFYLLIPAVIMLILFSGCPYESCVPLGDSGKSTIDKDLSGRWINLKSPNDTLLIIRFNDHEYYLETHEIKNGKMIISRGRGFTVLIDKEKFLNFHELSEPAEFNFMRYEITGNTMIGFTVSDSLIKEPFTRSQDLFNFFKKNMNRKGFYDVADTLVKVR